MNWYSKCPACGQVVGDNAGHACGKMNPVVVGPVPAPSRADKVVCLAEIELLTKKVATLEKENEKLKAALLECARDRHREIHTHTEDSPSFETCTTFSCRKIAKALRGEI